ncbi:MAG: pyruvate, phosphate dikinase [Treponema sp.]|nr:pyruvate, phosphate dikinase [Treponema sp.]
MAKQKNVYFFGDGAAEGDGSMRDILGGKGIGLAEMTNLGIPVPPGFTISTEVCGAYYANHEKYPDGLKEDVEKNLKRLEKLMGKRLGDNADPLLVSVRSGAAISMPGMMDTILNLGMNDKAVHGLAEKTGKSRFAWDAYRRFIQMYGDVVMHVPSEEFENALGAIKKAKGAELDTDLNEGDLEELVAIYKKIVKSTTGKDFPQNPIDQLWGAIGAVFGSWMNERAIKYREINGIKEGDLKGTAVNIQSMVFGNFGEDSGTGVCFSRDPSTGEKVFYGEYLMNAQGEDVVAGVRTPEKLATLERENKALYDQLVKIKNRLEKHFHDMQDMEFTVQQGKLFLLQTRNGKRTGAAAVKCAIDMVKEGLIDKKTAITRVTPELLDQIFHPMIEPKALKTAKALTKGLAASPGAATGQIVFSAKDAEEWHKQGKKVLLVRKETSPEDISGMVVSQGILTSTGGMTSHAAVVARGMGVPCVAGAKGVTVQGKKVDIGGKNYKEGDWITIDGSTGEVYDGALLLVQPKISSDVQTFLSWCDDIRAKSVRGKVKGFDVRTNADQPNDAKRAFEFGAQGVGLCRTEHMFFDGDKLLHFRAMIVADTEDERKEALKKILPLQQKDFFGIFKAMEGRPVIIRLLDPPLHEFVPHTKEEVAELAKQLGMHPKLLQPKIDKLHEANPMLGHRGCRLAVTYPEIYDMQVEAIARAAADCAKKNIPVMPEIMIPIVGDERELALIRPRSEAIVKRVLENAGVKLHVEIGTMIEVPRATLVADRIAKYADFFSFGTNDLTQMTLGFSRDDIGSFLPSYLEKKVLDVDPFKSIDEAGVGQLIQGAVEKGRSVNPGLSIGICGEHGGDPATIDFCYRAGLSYVSCSPFRVPIARLAGAQAVIRHMSKISVAEVAAELKRSRGRPPAAAKPIAEVVAEAIEAPAPAVPETVEAPAPKRGRGRPPAAKPAAEVVAEPVAPAVPETAEPSAPKRGRGRPPAAKPAAEVVAEPVAPAVPEPVEPPAPKRGRGRPPAANRAAEVVEVHIEAPAPAVPETVEAPAPKRGRGRPPAAMAAAGEGDETVAPAVAGPGEPTAPKRGRGRPPAAKPAAEVVAEPVAPAVPETVEPPAPKRGRGRPPAAAKRVAEVVAEPAEAPAPVGSDTPEPPAPKRGRGRPPATKPVAEVSAPAVPETVEPPAPKRGRGRPPAAKRVAEVVAEPIEAPAPAVPETAEPPAPKRGRGRPPAAAKRVVEVVAEPAEAPAPVAPDTPKAPAPKRGREQSAAANSLTEPTGGDTDTSGETPSNGASSKRRKVRIGRAPSKE